MEVAMSEAPEGLHVDERQLAAILAADVVGYSRLMGRDEDETVRDLEAHKAAILPLIAPDYTPVIAVLPFASADGDTALDRLGPSFAREVTSVLSTFPLMRVVSASDLPPQKVANPKQAAQELGVNYALSADLAKSGEKLRVRAQLTDAASGETVWSNSYEFQGEDPVAVQEKTAERVYGEIGGISGKVRKIEEAAAWRKQESALTDYDYYLRSMTYFMRYTPDDNLRSRTIAEEGLQRFPDSPLLKNRLSWTYILESEAAYGLFENCRETIDIAYKLGREAEDANNKSRFLIYQNLKLMTHVYAWRRSIGRSSRLKRPSQCRPMTRNCAAWLFSSPMLETLTRPLNGAYGRPRTTNKGTSGSKELWPGRTTSQDAPKRRWRPSRVLSRSGEI